MTIFSGKTVLVTGHSGFKGSWLCQWLLLLEAKVHGYSISIPTDPSLYVDLNLSSQLVSEHWGDISCLDSIQNVFKIIKPDFVFHLAAQPIVSVSYQDPVQTFLANTLGSINVFESLRRLDLECTVIFVTSDKCYENNEWTYGYREIDRLGGHDPYSSSKACAEIALASLAKSYPNRSFRMATARAGNVIGGGDWSKSRIIPDCVRSWQNNKPALLRSPNSTRPWQHVLEPLNGYLCLAHLLSINSDLDSQSFNFGPSSENPLPVCDLVSILGSEFLFNEIAIDNDVLFGKECSLLRLDVSKASSLLGWNALLTQREAVVKTANWYLRYLAGSSAVELCTSDIVSFSSRTSFHV